MNQISNNPGQQQQGQHSVQPVAHQPIRFQQQQHPGYPPVQQQYPNNVGYPQPYYVPQNMMHANPVNHATLTLPQNSSIIHTSQTNGINLVDVVSPPYAGAYEQPTILPHMVNAYHQQYGMYGPQHVQYQQPAMPQQPVAPKPAQPPREKKILSFVDPNSGTQINLPEKKAVDVSTASSPFEPKHDTKPHTPVNEVATQEVAAAAPETEDINSTFSRMVANSVVPAKTTASNQPHEDEHRVPPPAATTTTFTSTAPPFVPTSASYVSAVPSFNPAPTTFSANAAPFDPASFKNKVAKHVEETTPTPKEQSPALETPEKVEHSSTPEQKAAPSIVLEEPQPETSGVDEDKNETAEIPQNLDRASLMHEYEKRLDEFVSVPENMHEIVNKVYSRKLVQLLREIIKNFHTVPCPISEAELKRIGIDRATMPQPANVSHKSKYQGGRGDNFNPSWNNQQNQQIRRPQQYTSRGSQNNKGKNQNNKGQDKAPPIAGRVSIQRQKMSTLTRDPNAWKPDVMNAGNSIDRIAKVRKDVRGLLNKITPTTYGDLSIEMINKCVWRDEESLPTVVELIFIKAVEEPTFVGIYSELCSSLHKAEHNMEKENFKRSFHGAIIRKCQSSFENTALSQYQESITKLNEQLKEEESKEEKDEKKIADLNEQIEEMKVKEKRRMLGTIKFISHLFRIGLLNYKIIENCIVILIRNAEQSGSELMIEYAVDLMKHVGPHVGHVGPNAAQKTENITKLDGYVTYLDKFKATVSNRVKFMIVDLMELRDKKWVKKGDGPKTKEEVKMDVLKEEEKNKQERDVYEQTADQNRKRSTAVDKHRQNYSSRPSIDKKDRQAAAVAASANSGQNTLKKDTSLLKFDQQRLGSTKKWGTPSGPSANANTNASSPSNKGKVIARQSIDARNNTSDARKSTSQKDNKTAVAPAQKADPRSASATPPPNEPSSSRSQNNTPPVTPEDQFNKAAFKSGFKERLQSYLDGADIDDVVKSLIEFNTELNNPVVFFEHMFSYCCEHLKLNEAKERHAVSSLVAKCYQNPVMKNAFSPAFKKYCKFLVENDIEGDVPHLKTTFPEFVARLMTAATTVLSKDLVEGFKEFHESENYMFARTLAEFGRILHSREEGDIAGPLSWLFEEFANADEHYKSDDMKQIFARQSIDYDENHKNLKELLSVS